MTQTSGSSNGGLTKNPHVCVAAGSVAGGVARYVVGLLLATGTGFPWATLFVNITGSFVIGFYALRQPPTAPLAATQKALIQENPQTIYWRVELLGDNQELAVQVQGAHALEPGKALELWVLPAPGVNDGQPVSLGLLPTRGTEHRVLTAAQRAALAGAKQLAVSLEPAGGSPTGLPTGPVLHVAALAPV